MTAIKFLAMPTETARALQGGAPDANGHVPERAISDGSGNPCRHCLQYIAEGEEMLILAYRPFAEAQPYAETGPVFLHARPCERHAESPTTPDYLLNRDSVIVRGYTDANRILYGTGQVVRTADIATACVETLENPDVAYVHVRSSTDNCFHCRVERSA